jgi:hypothetical protein
MAPGVSPQKFEVLANPLEPKVEVVLPWLDVVDPNEASSNLYQSVGERALTADW